MAIGLGSVLVGLTVSYYADLPPGGTIVLVAAGRSSPRVDTPRFDGADGWDELQNIFR